MSQGTIWKLPSFSDFMEIVRTGEMPRGTPDKSPPASPYQVSSGRLSSGRNSKPSKYQCDQCGEKYTRKFSLSRHLRSHDKNANVRCPFKCAICLKGFTSKQGLERHVATVGDLGSQTSMRLLTPSRAISRRPHSSVVYAIVPIDAKIILLGKYYVSMKT
jgi:DNA-directed RNA polymerase subunit RPC12/RpoP